MILVQIWQLQPIPKPLFNTRCIVCSVNRSWWMYFATSGGEGNPICSGCYLFHREQFPEDKHQFVEARLVELHRRMTEFFARKFNEPAAQLLELVQKDFRLQNLVLADIVTSDRLAIVHRQRQ